MDFEKINKVKKRDWKRTRETPQKTICEFVQIYPKPNNKITVKDIRKAL